MRQAITESISEGLLLQRTGDDFARIQECHRAIAKAIRAQDAGAATVAMARHFETALSALEHSTLRD
jgi:DNA-binding GntR family transcriptional regulator